jgi:3D (Asp-Asp-Asp) domain-containing protein
MTPTIGMVLLVKLTAYTADCAGCSGVMADGRRADHRLQVVAASTAWPLGTCLELRLGERTRRVQVADRLGPRTRRQPGADRHLDLLVAGAAQARALGVQQVRARVVSCKG